MKWGNAWLAGVTALLTLGFTANAESQDRYGNVEPTLNDLGGVGLLQMPSARHADEGEFSLLYYDNEEYRRMAVSLQLFPWFEAIIRYNDIRTRLYSQSEDFSGDQTYKDRGVDVKFRLLEEGQWLPETSLGLRDVAGTGKFAGEYLAMSKRFGPLDLTLGLGFGYVGNRSNVTNPFCEISDSYCERGDGYTGKGGQFETGKWFHGPAAVFAGVEYQTPWQPLTLKAEYDGNDYANEPSLTAIPVDSPWNIGVHYRLNDYVNLQLSYERGNTLMFGFSLRTNFNDMRQVKVAEEPQQPVQPQALNVEQINTQRLVQRLQQESGWNINKLTANKEQDTVTLYGAQTRYRDKVHGLTRASRVLASELPATVSDYQLVNQQLGSQLSTEKVDAITTKKAWFNTDLTTKAGDAFSVAEIPAAEQQKTLYQKDFGLQWPSIGVRPKLEQSFGGPENFYMYQLLAQIDLGWRLMPELYIDGRVGVNLLTNFDDFNFLVEDHPNYLPRVRTYVREYVTYSDVWLDHLQATYIKQLSPNWYTSVYGGYFERMFGGLGNEWLYRPLAQNWAVGVDLNWAKQRSFESYTGFRDYEVVTGHITGYWQPKFMDNTTVQLAAGRFLAGDNGVQLNVSKQFDSGIIVGAYAAKTNVSAQEYGEGSFTKGFYISIPLDLFQRQYSRSYGSIGWSPLTRDGGQMLQRQTRLFGVTQARSPFYQ